MAGERAMLWAGGEERNREPASGAPPGKGAWAGRTGPGHAEPGRSERLAPPKRETPSGQERVA